MKNKGIENLPLRDSFIYTLQKIAEKDKKVILLTNDQGAPALDNFIKKLPKQFFNTCTYAYNYAINLLDATRSLQNNTQ